MKSYCLDCNWEISAADTTINERTAAMVNHAVTTGNDIESITQTNRYTTSSQPDQTGAHASSSYITRDTYMGQTKKKLP